MCYAEFKEQRLLLRELLAKKPNLEPYLVLANYDLVQIKFISKRFIYYLKNNESHKLERAKDVLGIFIDKESALEFLKVQVDNKVQEIVDLKFLVNKIDKIVLDKENSKPICPKCGGKYIEKTYFEKGSVCFNYRSKFVEYYLKESNLPTPNIHDDVYITDILVCKCSCGYSWEILPLDSKLKEEQVLKKVQESKDKAEQELEEYLREEMLLKQKQTEIENEIYLRTLERNKDNYLADTENNLSENTNKKPFWCKWFCKES